VEGRHIAVSGVLGAGKTTLVRGLAKELGYLALEERFEENPYLGAFYRDPRAWAFKSYTFFLQRSLVDYGRARGAKGGGVQERVLEEHLLIFCKEYHARGYLDEGEFALLRDLTLAAASSVSEPDLLLHIDIEPAEALVRLQHRGSPVESEIELDYLTSLNRRYAPMLSAWQGRLLRIDSVTTDFRNPAYMAELAQKIGKHLEAIPLPRPQGTDS
jgi:deoxyadenosine/deoxycytidine kinase